MDLPIRIAVTLPVFEEFAREAGGNKVEVISLIPPGADPYTYQFTELDKQRMKGIDFFFLNGRGLDSGLQDVIEAERDDDAHVIPFAPNTLSPGGSGQTAEQAGDNPHLWLDPSLASTYVEIVADELTIYDGVHRDYYGQQFAAFRQRMQELQAELAAQLRTIPPERAKLVTYHDSFEHYARKFGLQVAAYALETPESPAPQGTAERLTETVRAQGIPAVFADYGYDTGFMAKVADQAGVPVCTLYADIVDSAMSYEQMMRANADEIVRCLGG